MLDLEDLFAKHDKEYGCFERITAPRSSRLDLHAFLVLDELCPDAADMVGAAEHDKIYLDIDLRKLALAASEATIIDLIRCGVWLDRDNDSLAMFV